MRKTVYTLVFLFMFMFMFVSFIYAVSGDDSPPASLRKDIHCAGSGCQNASAKAILSDDNKTLSIIISQDIEVNVNPSTRAVKSKFCNMNVLIQTPSGWQYTILDVTYSGTAKLDKGVKATLTERYYFAGQKNESRAIRIISGPVDKNFTVTDKFKNHSWSSCSRNVGINIRPKLKIDKRKAIKGSGLVLTGKKNNAMDISVKRTYKLAWRQCK